MHWQGAQRLEGHPIPMGSFLAKQDIPETTERRVGRVNRGVNARRPVHPAMH